MAYVGLFAGRKRAINTLIGHYRIFQFRGWLNHQFSDWVDQSCTDWRFIRRMLVKEWPGIAFELSAIHDDR